MTLIVAFATSDYALLASDTRVSWRAPGAPAATRFADHGCKIFGTRTGWMTSSSSLEWRRALHELAKAKSERDGIRAAARAMAPGTMARIEADDPEHARELRDHLLTLVVGCDAAGLFRVALNWCGENPFPQTEDRRVVACGPHGSDQARVTALLNEYQWHVSHSGLFPVLRATGELFAAVHADCGPAGAVSPLVMAGLVYADGRRALLGAVPYDVLRTASDAELERWCPTVEHAPPPLDDGYFFAQAMDQGGSILPSGQVQTDGAQSRTIAKGIVTGAGAGGTVSRDSGTASGGAASSLSDATKSWTTDQWKGGWVVITGGLGSGQIAQVTGNNATQLTISGTWGTIPNNTSTYVVTAWVDGAAVTFPITYQDSPTVVLHEGSGLSVEPRAAQWTGAGANAYDATKPTYDQTEAVNVTASGFVLRSRLMQKITGAVFTSRGADFPTGNAVTTVGGTTISAALANAPAYNDQYEVDFSVTVSWDSLNKGIVQSVTVAVDTDPTGSGTWTQQATQTFQITPTAGASGSHLWGDGVFLLTVPGFTTSGKIRLRVTAAGGERNFSVHGFDTTDDSAHGVNYTTSSTPQQQIFASKTPDAGDGIAWEAKVVT